MDGQTKVDFISAKRAMMCWLVVVLACQMTSCKPRFTETSPGEVRGLGQEELRGVVEEDPSKPCEEDPCESCEEEKEAPCPEEVLLLEDPLDSRTCEARTQQPIDLDPLASIEDPSDIEAVLAVVDRSLENIGGRLAEFELREKAWELAYVGDLDGAIDLVRESLESAKQRGDLGSVVTCLGMQGALVEVGGDHLGAAEIFQEMDVLAQELQDPCLMVRAKASLAGNRLLQDGGKCAEGELKRVLRQAQKLKESQAASLALFGLGLAAINRGEEREAIDHWQRSVDLDPNGALVIIDNLAWAYASLGEHAKAAEMMASSVGRKSRNGFDRVGSLTFQGYVDYRAGRYDKAEANLRQAIGEYENLWSQDDDARRRITSRDFYSVPYELLMQVLVTIKEPGEALEVSERSRGRAFAHALSRLRGGPGKIPFAEPPDLRKIKHMAKRSRTHWVVYEVLHDSRKMLTANRFGGAQEAFEETLLMWLVKPDGEVIFKTSDLSGAKSESLAKLVRRLRSGIGVEKSRGSSPLGGKPGDSLAKLSELIWAPLAEHLSATESRVVIVPRGPLFQVPFAALTALDGLPLIVKHSVSVAPSIAVLEALPKGRPASASWRADEVLVVGNPKIPAERKCLESLPGAEQEARSIAESFGSQAIIGAEATLSTVKESMPRARLIHLASHGLLEQPAQRGFPGALVLYEHQGSGLLTADDVAQMSLRANLVVLSACDTGGGQITGDGVLGLSRAFLTAGAGSAVVSLWKVEDEATAFLMEKFYRHLRAGQEVASSMRSAMLETRRIYSSPSSWAGFAVIAAPVEASDSTMTMATQNGK